MFLLDQTKLPVQVETVEIKDAAGMWDAIRRLVVRGAPAIGLAAACGVCLGASRLEDAGTLTAENFAEKVREVGAYLDTARPTAVNLHWAVTRMGQAAERLAREAASRTTVRQLVQGLWAECDAIFAEDTAACRAIGAYGADLLAEIPGLTAVLTHCNAGALTASQYGTALAPVYVLAERGVSVAVYSDETRPLLQGARLTAWELSESGVPVTSICDSMAGVVMREGRVQAVIVGADRIASNGDVANKIGTYSVAVLARTHGLPFYVAAPLSTVDFALAHGGQIPIEERDASEIRAFNGQQTVPDGASVYNPAFDVTPHGYVTAIITEKGVAFPPFSESLEALRRGRTPPRSREKELRAQVLRAAKSMVSDGLATGSFGNISAADRESGCLIITPSGVPYADMTEEDLCLVRLDGSVPEGVSNGRKPSSELALHCAVYRARPDCGAVVHTHSPYCTAFAASTATLGPVISEMGMIAPGAVPKVAYYPPGSVELAQQTAEVLAHANGCLLANHGAVTAADTLERAYFLAQVLEDGARAGILAGQLGAVQEIPPESREALFAAMQHYGR